MGKSYKELKKKIAELNDLLNVRDNRIAVLLMANAAFQVKIEGFETKSEKSLYNKVDSKKLVAQYLYDFTDEFFTTKNIVIADRLNINSKIFLKILSHFKDEKIIDVKTKTVDRNALLKYLTEEVVNTPTTSKHEKGIEEAFISFFENEKSVEKKFEGFSSWFMFNVKFKIPKDTSFSFYSLVSDTDYKIDGKFHKYFYGASFNSEYKVFDFYPIESDFKAVILPEVSIYEVIPELVPKGMVYDKESDSLVQLDVDGVSVVSKTTKEEGCIIYDERTVFKNQKAYNNYCAKVFGRIKDLNFKNIYSGYFSGFKETVYKKSDYDSLAVAGLVDKAPRKDSNFILSLTSKYLFSYNKCAYIVDEFGSEAEDVLQECQVHCINPSSLKRS